MIGSGSRVDLPPPGGIAWLDLAPVADAPAPSPGRIGPLYLRVAALAAARSPFYVKSARLRGIRCVWSAGTFSGAELSRSGRASLPEGETAVHLLVRADGAGNVFDGGYTLSNPVLKVFDPAVEVVEQFPSTNHVFTLNVHAPLLGIEPSALAAMKGESFLLTPFQTALLRAAVGLLLTGTEEVGSPSSLIGIDRYLGAMAGLLLRTAVRRTPDRDQILSVRTRAETIIDEQATDLTLTPAAVAAQLSVSLRQLYRAFAGPESPAALIRRRRLELAADLLASHGAIGSMDVVARECGFASAEYFSRAFRREFGLSPRAYRSAHRDTAVAHEVPTH